MLRIDINYGQARDITLMFLREMLIEEYYDHSNNPDEEMIINYWNVYGTFLNRAERMRFLDDYPEIANIVLNA